MRRAQLKWLLEFVYFQFVILKYRRRLLDDVMVKFRHFLIFTIVFAVLLLPIRKANCQDYVEYDVNVNGDGSASWKIIQVSDISAPIDTWESFQQRVFDLVDSAAVATQREMTSDTDSMQIETVISSESKTTEYLFTWQNFSLIQNGAIVFGDVFQVSDFFAQLYGDASLQITYPSTFIVKTVSPAPNERDAQTQALVWFRTQDFVNGNPNIVLTSSNPVENGNSGDWQLYLVAGVLAVTGASIAGFIFFRRRRSNAKTVNAQMVGMSSVESDEEKIVKILKSSGGTTRQSAIAEQSKFSKAKTSQLLAALEQKGVVTRYKKGRDKIVTLK